MHRLANDAPLATAGTLQTGHRYLAVVKVRSNGISVMLNGKLVCQRAIDHPHPYYGVANFFLGDQGLGFDASDSVLFHRIQLTEITGTGHEERVPLGQPPALAKPPPDDTPKRVVDLMPLIDSDSDAVNGSWVRTAMDLRSMRVADNKAALLRIRYLPPDEYDFRVKFTRLDGRGGISQVLCHDDHGFAFRYGKDGCSCGVERIGNFPGLAASSGKPVVPTEVRTPCILTTGTTYVSIVHVRRNVVSASVNGKLVMEYPTDYSNLKLPAAFSAVNGSLGIGCDGSNTFIFHSIEIAEITGDGKPLSAK